MAKSEEEYVELSITIPKGDFEAWQRASAGLDLSEAFGLSLGLFEKIYPGSKEGMEYYEVDPKTNTETPILFPGKS